jgi:hypothetical protein
MSSVSVRPSSTTAPTIVEPAQGADPCVDDVEPPAAQGVHRVVHIGFHERGLEAARGGQRTGRLQGRGREVEAGHRGTVARPRERVGPQVALEVDELRAGDRAAELLHLEGAQVVPLLPDEPLQVVLGARPVERRRLVPEGPVDGAGLPGRVVGGDHGAPP